MKFKINSLIIILIISIISLNFNPTNAKTDKCYTMSNLHKHIESAPELNNLIQSNNKISKEWISSKNSNKTNNIQSNDDIITIPVVVHVIYNKTAENISETQIMSQIDALNKDFRKLNSDILTDVHPFFESIGDAKIEFVLAKQDENGFATTGITRTKTSVTLWDDNNLEYIKNAKKGGVNNWDPTKYLNLYSVNLTSDLLGFSSFPDELTIYPDQDGVVIGYKVFGTTGVAGQGQYIYNNLGRTGTHEVGHWLGLYHIWGDDDCGDDMVDDTYPSETANYECPTFPYNQNNRCGGGLYGEMYMNYMDYVFDRCMNMFTNGQVDRMHAALTNLRPGILTSNGAKSITNVEYTSNNEEVEIYPNPSNGKFNVVINNTETNTNLTTNNLNYKLLNILGEVVYEFGNFSGNNLELSIYDISFNNGIYYLIMSNENQNIVKKIIINK